MQRGPDAIRIHETPNAEVTRAEQVPVAPTVPFNRATVAPLQVTYVEQAFASGHLSGDGPFSDRVAERLRHWLGAEAVLLTPSCTDALEMTALLCDLRPGDEVIVPSFTFVSTANAFALLGVTPVFADVDPDTLNITPEAIAALVGPRTRAVVVVHYGGVACDMAAIGGIARSAGIRVIEDNAHGLLGRYQGRPLGSLGAMATLSFHETKNFSCGEGGALVLNDPELVARAEVIREKGTNRSQFFRGQVDKYTWVDLGSSYLLGEPLAAILLAQLEFAAEIQARRHAACSGFRRDLADWSATNDVRFLSEPTGSEHPAHLFAMWMPDLATRSAFITHMRHAGVQAAFHYQSLHTSPMGLRLGGSVGACPVTEAATDCIVRLPVFSDMTTAEYQRVVDATLTFEA